MQMNIICKQQTCKKPVASRILLMTGLLLSSLFYEHTQKFEGCSRQLLMQGT